MYSLLVLLLLFPTIHSKNYEFFHLLGYAVNVTYTDWMTSTDPTACVKKCALYDGCLGILMDRYERTCYIIDKFMAVFEAPEECAVYALKKPKIKHVGRTLNEGEQLLYNLMYASNGTCPDEWYVDKKQCTYYYKKPPGLKDFCLSYSSFTGARWDGSQCVLKKRF
uniref:C-type lectin domain-containing protein n=1 Tax=Panagrellus redivivus TaxID=6233 RepID=A0A7E4W1U3_PANRE